MKNQISIKQYNPNKPAKYGLLFKFLNDGCFPYTYNSLVYAGKPDQGDEPFYIEGIETYKNIGRKNMFKTTSRTKYINGPLHKHTYCKLVVGKHITIVGTLMTNRRGIPNEIKIVTNREEFSQTRGRKIWHYVRTM